MLVDAAKGGDVEIPVFCYEPKLGGPVGACRMCLVEVEGIPKLQTACSTPVRDGMVVYTQTDRVQEAQNAVVEFLLVNHPLDCPVCDKGGECPLQDISMGWGAGQAAASPTRSATSRSPCPLSPLVRIDRERCILCYRCVRFSPGGRRGRAAPAPRARAALVRRHLRRPPLHRALPRQHHRALPRRRPHLGGLPLPRPAVGHRGRRLGLHALPVAVQRQVHRPRRAGRARPCARQPRGRRRLALRQGPLRLPDVPLRGPACSSPMVRTGGALHKATLGRGAREGRGRPQGRRAPDRDPDRQPGLERGGLPAPADRPPGARLAARRLARRRSGLERETALALGRPGALGVAMSDIDGAETVLVVGTDPLHSMPILDLRLRKAMRNQRHPRRRRLRAPDRARRRLRGDASLRARRGRGGSLEPRCRAGELRGRRPAARTPSGSLARSIPATPSSSTASGSATAPTASGRSQR